MAASLLGSSCAGVVFARALRVGAGVHTAWLGLLLFSSARLLLHLLQYPRLQRSLARRARAAQCGEAAASAAAVARASEATVEW